jgi:hypothetical protein
MSVETVTELLGGEWRQHHKHPAYFFSRCGKAAKLTIKKGGPYVALLKGTACGRGYRAVSYPLGGRRYGRIYIHRGVCELFHGPCPDGMECRHLDGDHTNNRASNLAWGTTQQNSDDKIAHGTVCRGESNPMSKLTTDKVQEMRRVRSEQKTPYYVLGQQFGVSTMTAYRAVVGKSWN